MKSEHLKKLETLRLGLNYWFGVYDTYICAYICMYMLVIY